MHSSGRASDQGSQTSRTSSSESSYLSAPSLGSSSGQQNSVGGRSMLFSPQRQHETNASSEYVSPYPPLPTQRSASPAARPIATTEMGAAALSTIASASSSSASQQEKEAAQKQALIDALNEHRINTIGELRRVERIFATLGSSDLTSPMTAAWMYYVNSNSLLAEIRALTRNYPFSSELLDEAKRRVYQDPSSNRSWNYCWLVLAKIQSDLLIPTYARAQASRPEMWGGCIPSNDSIDKLCAAFVREWSSALAQLLRYWEYPPTNRTR